MMSRRKPSTRSLVAAILVVSVSAAGLEKPRSWADSWRSAMIFSIRGPLSKRPASGPWSEARVPKAVYASSRSARLSA
jgi:hypothetical protein